jgi:hypothetical protein
MKLTVMIAVMALVAVPALADQAKSVTSTRNGKPYFEASEKMSVKATITKIDVKGRVLTLKEEAGDTVSVEAGPDVRNFNQLAIGDQVKITYTQKLTAHVEAPEPGAPGAVGAVTETTSVRSKPGEKPGGSLTATTTYRATIVSIDKTKGTATLKGADGQTFTIVARFKENLDKVAVGEIAVFTYTEAIAAKVEKSAKAPAKPPAKK